MSISACSPTPPLTGREALVEFNRPGFLDRVDDRVGVGADRDRGPASSSRRAGPMPSARSRRWSGRGDAATTEASEVTPSRWVA